MFVKALGDSSMLRVALLQWHSRFVVGAESIKDAEQSGRPGTKKTNENIARVAAVLKDNYRGENHHSPQSIGWFEKMKTEHDWCRMHW